MTVWIVAADHAIAGAAREALLKPDDVYEPWLLLNEYDGIKDGDRFIIVRGYEVSPAASWIAKRLLWDGYFQRITYWGPPGYLPVSLSGTDVREWLEA